MKFLKIFAISVCFVSLIIIVGKHTNPLIKLDGFNGLILRIILFTDDSEYSKDYTHEKFLEINKGMTVEKVYSILGKPIRADMEDVEYSILWYSWSPKSTHYRRRNVIIEDNRVSHISSEYYID